MKQPCLQRWEQGGGGSARGPCSLDGISTCVLGQGPLYAATGPDSPILCSVPGPPAGSRATVIEQDAHFRIQKFVIECPKELEQVFIVRSHLEHLGGIRPDLQRFWTHGGGPNQPRSETVEPQAPGMRSGPQRVCDSLRIARWAPMISAGRGHTRITREELADVAPGVGWLRGGLVDAIETDEAVAALETLIFDGNSVARRHRDDTRVGRATFSVFFYFRHQIFSAPRIRGRKRERPPASLVCFH